MVNTPEQENKKPAKAPGAVQQDSSLDFSPVGMPAQKARQMWDNVQAESEAIAAERKLKQPTGNQPMYPIPSFVTPEGEPNLKTASTPGGSPFGLYNAEKYREAKSNADQLRTELESRNKPRNISNYPTVKDIVYDARMRGANITADDVSNLVDFATLDSAARKLIQLNGINDLNGMQRVTQSLAKTNPLMASLLPDYIADKLSEAAHDPNIVDKSMGILGDIGSKVNDALMAANDWMMTGVRAANITASGNTLGETPLSWIPMAVGFLSPSARSEVVQGNYDANYIQNIVDSKNYTDLQFQIALEVHSRAAQGDPNAIMTVWQDPRYNNNLEATKVFQDIIYNRAEGNTQELLRQIDSAHKGNTGQTIFGTSGDYSDARGTQTYQNLANVSGGVASFVLDPTNLLFGAGKLYQASKWSLLMLDPAVSAEAGGAMRLMRKMRFGKLEITNPVYRYFDSFAKDLNNLDDLERGIREAPNALDRTALQQQLAGARNRMTRQYNEMPEQLIEDFRNSTWRNPDGKFDVEHLAAHIDDTNDAYMTVAGEVAQTWIDAGAEDWIKREALQRLQTAKGQTFTAQVATTNQRRTALVPRMSIAAEIRKNAANKISVSLMPGDVVERRLNLMLASETPGEFAEALSSNAELLGGAARRYKFGTREGVFDSATRMFSSLPDQTFVSIADASDAKRVYRLARTFFPKRTSEMIAEAFRQATPGQRRTIVSGLVRSAASSRGLVMTVEEADGFMRQLSQAARATVTGSLEGERYGLTVKGSVLPSERAAAATAVVDAANESGVYRSLSADSKGIEHAMHLDQTSNFVAFPSLKDFEQLRTGVYGGVSKGVGTAAQKITDYWSIGTLFGLRFSIRNAIEEVGMYWLTGGHAMDAFKGRRASQGIRRVQGDLLFAKKGAGGRTEWKPVFKGRLGMIATPVTKAKRLANQRGGMAEWMTNLILGKGGVFSDEQILNAEKAFRAGDTEAWNKLAMKSIAAQRVTGLKPGDMDALSFLTDSTHGMHYVDEIAESARYLNSGGYGAFKVASDGALDLPPGVTAGTINPASNGPRFLGFGNIQTDEFLIPGIEKTETFANAFWWKELQSTMNGDGPIGKAAVQLIRNPAAAKEEVANIIRKDTEWGYKTRLSRIYNDKSIDDFANSYVENVFAHFSRKDGTLNEELLNKFIDADGNVSWWHELPDGGRIHRVDLGDLSVIGPNDRPDYVFGQVRDMADTIPIAEQLPGLLTVDRTWGWMGAQNARISREPLFIANYLDQYRKSEPARIAMAKAMAGDAVEKFDDFKPLADKLYARQAMDDAYTLTLSYIDNPANRSNLAWKARNVARYYRATEDFYRRMGRVAKHSPEAFWKASLIYHILDDTGFTYTDDNGDQYFAYPGNEMLQDGVGNIANHLFGIGMQGFQQVDPFFMGGKVLGLSPSLDPTQAVPSFSGPVAGAPLAMIFSKFPALAGLRTLALGQYSEETGNVFSDLVNQIAPAGISRLFEMISPEVFDSKLAQAGFDAMAVMQAENMYDKFTVTNPDGSVTKLDPATVTQDKFKETDQWQQTQLVAVGLFFAKSMMSWVLPAAPQVEENTSSQFARMYGIDSMSDAFRDLVEANSDKPDPYAASLSQFFAMQSKNGGTMLPFTVSSTRWKEGSVAALAKPLPTEDYFKWYYDDKTSDILAHKDFGKAYYFLSPITKSPFSWGAYSIQTAIEGLRLKKADDTMIKEILNVNARYVEGKLRDSYEPLIANAKSTSERQAYEAELAAGIAENKAMNPIYNNSFKGSDQQNYDDAYSSTKAMLKYIKQSKGKLDTNESAIQAAIDVYDYYSGPLSGLQGGFSAVRDEKNRINGLMQSDLAVLSETNPYAERFITSVINRLQAQ